MMLSAWQFVYIYFLFSCVRSVYSADEDGLKYLQILFRHGDRSPIHLYPHDPNPKSVWPEGLGMLSKLGRRQHFNLGRYFRNKYKDFITTDPTEIDVQSSDVDRCQKSALSNLATFYAPNGKWVFEETFDWQPINVLYIPKDEDRYLETDTYCPRAFEEENRIINSPKGQEIIRKYQEMFDNLTENSGLEIKNWVDASHLYDTLKIEKRYNLSVPLWATPYWEQLHHVCDMSFYWSFDSKLIRRLRVGPLIGKIVENMKKKVKGGENPEKRVQIFSAHDTNVALVLHALNVSNWKQPPYCSTILFELHSMNGSHFVRILFMNSTSPEKEIDEPHVLVLNNCSEFCPLEHFINYTADIIPADWESECKIESSFFEKISTTNVAVPVVFSVLVAFILIFSAYSIWKFQFRGQGRYYRCYGELIN